MTSESALRFIHRLFHGNLHREKTYPSKSGIRPNKPMWCLILSDAMTRKLLELVVPYLRVKKAQAELILQLGKSKPPPEARIRGSTTKRTMKVEILRFREKLYQMVKGLNHSRST